MLYQGKGNRKQEVKGACEEPEARPGYLHLIHTQNLNMGRKVKSSLDKCVRRKTGRLEMSATSKTVRQ